MSDEQKTFLFTQSSVWNSKKLKTFLSFFSLKVEGNDLRLVWSSKKAQNIVKLLNKKIKTSLASVISKVGLVPTKNGKLELIAAEEVTLMHINLIT